MAGWRNGPRLVEADQQPSRDWLVWDGRREALVEDRVFRVRWEPADEEAREMWRGRPELVAQAKEVRGRWAVRSL